MKEGESVQFVKEETSRAQQQKVDGSKKINKSIWERLETRKGEGRDQEKDQKK